MDMKTYQEKAEAYVRQQLPELLELSFGCQVMVDWGSGGVHRAFITRWLDTSMNMPQYFVTPFGNGREFCTDKSKMEIIGHPIQLQHWLRVLSDAANDEARFENYLESWSATEFTWTFSDDECRTIITFNLTTGQPKTEADHQAVCKVLGI